MLGTHRTEWHTMNTENEQSLDIGTVNMLGTHQTEWHTMNTENEQSLDTGKHIRYPPSRMAHNEHWKWTEFRHW